MKDKNDNVYHPQHYQIPGLPVESIVIIRAILGAEGFKKFCRGNAMKYLIRADNKGGIEDLKKARVYLSWEIGDSPDGVDIIEAAKNISNYCSAQSCSPECMFFNSHNAPCALGTAPDMWEIDLKENDEEDGCCNAIDGKEASDNMQPIEAAKVLKAYCHKLDDCEGCVFDCPSESGCILTKHIPTLWELSQESLEKPEEIDGDES